MTNINLASGDFLKAACWGGMLNADELYYHGALVDKAQLFQPVKGGVVSYVSVVHVIRREEDFVWEAARDLLDRAVKQAAMSVRGIYCFELLTFEAKEELKTFNYNELAQVLVNTARGMRPGDQVLIKYSSVYGLLQKMTEESWGKIAFKTMVDLAPPKASYVFTVLSKMLKALKPKAEPVLLLVNDLGDVPVFDAKRSEEEQFLLDDFVVKCAKGFGAAQRQCFIRNAQGVRKIYG